jgi:hypothetical protein
VLILIKFWQFLHFVDARAQFFVGLQLLGYCMMFTAAEHGQQAAAHIAAGHPQLPYR